MFENDEKYIVTRAVREILGGKPVSDFPVDMLPKIREGLYEAKDKAVNQGQVSRVKLIQQAFTQIQECEKKHRRMMKRNEKLSSDYVPPQSTKPQQSELEDLLDKIMSGEEVDNIEPDVIPHLIKQIKKRIHFHNQSDEFEVSQNYEELHQMLAAQLRNIEKSNKKVGRQNDLIEKLENAEQFLIAAQKEYDDELNELEKITAEAIEKANQYNQSEVEKFDSESQGPLPPFSKTFSSELQNLRETQKHLILCKRYKDAAVVRDKLKEICEIELEGIEDKHMRQRELRRAQMLDNQAQRIQCILMKSETQRIEIIDSNEKKIESIKKMILNLESKLDNVITSKRMLSQQEASLIPNYYPVKPSKMKRTNSERLLYYREPWSFIFDKKKINKYDELYEPRWKTVEPHRTETEVFSQIVSSATLTPKNEKISKKVRKTPKSLDNRNRKIDASSNTAANTWKSGQFDSNNNESGNNYGKRIQFGNDVGNGNKSSSNDIRKAQNLRNQKRQRNGGSPKSLDQENEASFKPKINIAQKQLKKQYVSFFRRSNSNDDQENNNIDINNVGRQINRQSNQSQSTRTSFRFDANNSDNNKRNNSARTYSNKGDNIFNRQFENKNNVNINNYRYQSQDQNNVNDNNKFKNMTYSGQDNVSQTNHKTSQTVNSTTKGVSTTDRANSVNSSIYKNNTNNSKGKNNRVDFNLNSRSQKSSTSTNFINNANYSNSHKSTKDTVTKRSSTSFNNSHSNYGNYNNYNNSNDINNCSNDSSDLTVEYHFNGMTYTQKIDERRNHAIQTKKKLGIANIFGEKSDFQKFCDTVPPSRKNQLKQYT